MDLWHCVDGSKGRYGGLERLRETLWRSLPPTNELTAWLEAFSCVVVPSWNDIRRTNPMGAHSAVLCFRVAGSVWGRRMSQTWHTAFGFITRFRRTRAETPTGGDRLSARKKRSLWRALRSPNGSGHRLAFALPVVEGLCTLYAGWPGPPSTVPRERKIPSSYGTFFRLQGVNVPFEETVNEA